MGQVQSQEKKIKTAQEIEEENRLKKQLEEQKKKNYLEYANMWSSHPMIQLTSNDQNVMSSMSIEEQSIIFKVDPASNIQVYLPGYLRIKFKNFNSLHLEQFYGQYNAVMIFTIYYGAALEHLRKRLNLEEEHQKKMMKSLENQLVMIIGNEEAIELAALVEDEQKIGSNSKQKDSQKMILKPSIQTVVRLDKNNKQIHFTIRKNFKVSLESSVFLSPFERIDTNLDISVLPLVVQINEKSKKSKTSFTFNINLLTSLEQKKDTIQITEAKKFGKYGLILPELNALYSNQSLDGLKGKQKRQKDEIQRLKSDIKKVFSQQAYVHLRESYREYAEKYKDQLKGLSLKVDDDERKYLFSTDRQTEKSKSRHFFIEGVSEQPFKAYNDARFIIPLYKFPFNSIASIFFPLWLLAILTLGIFFQENSLGGRIVSIASLMIAFIAFIPTITKQIPPTSKIVLTEIIIYAVAISSLLALIQSLQVMYIDAEAFKLIKMYENPYFIASLIIDAFSFLIIVFLTVYHYAVRQKYYKTEDTNKEKSQLYKERWHNKECDTQVKKKFTARLFDYQIAPKQIHKVYEIKPQKSKPKQTIMKNREEDSFLDQKTESLIKLH